MFTRFLLHTHLIDFYLGAINGGSSHQFSVRWNQANF